MLRLLSATRSPYPRKVHIVLREKSIAFAIIEVQWNQDASAPAFNPSGKIPCCCILIERSREHAWQSEETILEIHTLGNCAA